MTDVDHEAVGNVLTCPSPNKTRLPMRQFSESHECQIPRAELLFVPDGALNVADGLTQVDKDVIEYIAGEDEREKRPMLKYWCSETNYWNFTSSDNSTWAAACLFAFTAPQTNVKFSNTFSVTGFQYSADLGVERNCKEQKPTISVSLQSAVQSPFQRSSLCFEKLRHPVSYLHFSMKPDVPDLFCQTRRLRGWSTTPRTTSSLTT